MGDIFLSFREWPYPNPKKSQVRCAQSECGLLAISFGQNIIILTEDDGNYTPITMWSLPTDADVLYMSWMDGSLSEKKLLPILAVCSNNKNVSFYDVKERAAITAICLKNDTPTCVKFFTAKRNHLYIGTENGMLIHAKLDRQQRYKQLFSYTLKHPINFIAIDPIFCSTVAVASESGNYTVIQNGKIKIDNYALSENIQTFDFYSESCNYILISTTAKSFIYAISEMSTINFISIQGIVNLHTINDKFIVVGKDSVRLFRLKDKKNEWDHYSDITIPVSQQKFLCSSILNNKIVLIISPLKLYVVELRREKLFLINYCELLNCKPIDWSFWKGSIAITTNDGKLHISEPVRTAVKNCQISEEDERKGIPFDRITGCKCGSSCKFLYTYDLSTCHKEMRVNWISNSIVVAWNQKIKNIVIVDLLKRTTKDLIPLKLFPKDDIDITISQIIISPTKENLCLVVNRLTVILFHCPDMKVVSPIPLREPSVGTFSDDGASLLFFSITGVLYYYDTNGKLNVSQNFGDIPETISLIYHKGDIFTGNDKGDLIRYSGKPLTREIVYHNESEIAFAQLTKCDDVILAIDRSKKAFFMNRDGKECTALSKNVDNVKHAIKNTVLIKFHGQKKLVPFPLVGKFVRHRPPCFFRSRLFNDNLDEFTPKTIHDFASIGISLISKILVYDQNPIKKQTEVLMKLFQGYSKMGDVYYQLALITKNYDICKNILKKTPPKAPNYLWNITSLALFDLDKPGTSVETSISALKETGNFDYCYELLLMTKSFKQVIEIMRERNDFKNVFYFIRNQNNLPECEEEIEKLANSMLENKYTILPILIMAQLKLYKHICNYIPKLSFSDQIKDAAISFIKRNFNVE